jgi:outer membrane lipoprotein-sorting protein
MKLKMLFASLALLSLSTACHGYIREVQQEYILSHLDKLHTYEGTMVESGALADGAELTSEISYQRPNEYLIRVTSPEKHKGSVFYFDGTNLLMYYPMTKFAIEYKNVLPLSEDDGRKLLRDQFDWNMDHYHYEITRTGSVAGFKTEQMEFKAKDPKAIFASGSTQIYDPISFPMSGIFRWKNGGEYSFRFTKFRFNESNIKIAKPVVPSDVTYSRWDMNSKSFTLAEMKAASNFKCKLPSDLAGSLPRQMSLRKIIRQEGMVPAFTLLYEKKPYFLNLTVFKDYGISGIPEGRGLPLKTGKKGALITGPHSTFYSFVSGGTQYILVGNLPFEEILELSEKL